MNVGLCGRGPEGLQLKPISLGSLWVSGDFLSNFPELYARLARNVGGDGHLTAGLRPKLGDAYEAIVGRPYDVPRIVEAVEHLLEYLASPEGRTHANCVAVDSFFCLRDDWAGDWEDEPGALADVLGDMGGALHDTIAAPEIAENFDSTPELLLEQLRVFKRSLPAA